MQIAENGDSIATSNLKNALDHVGIKLPMYRVRELLNDLKTQGKACDQKGVSKEVFREVSLHSCIRNNIFFELREPTNDSLIMLKLDSARQIKDKNATTIMRN